MIYNLTNYTILYNLIDDGIANVLGLETLRHGTNSLNYLSIHIWGGDPKQGGKSTGSTKITEGVSIENTQNYFYLFKDSEFFMEVMIPSTREQRLFLHTVGAIMIQFHSLTKRCLPKIHAVLSSYAFFTTIIPKTNNLYLFSRFFCGTIGSLIALATPTIKFRYGKIDPNVLKEDEAYSGMAYKTKQKVEAWRIGVLGSLCSGLTLDWYTRAQRNPMKIVTGLMQLIGAGFFLRYINTIKAKN